MQEENVFFNFSGFRLAGLYHHHPGDVGVVITHPHPQMGGSMDNNVVEALVKVFDLAGVSTLRFNFRGVGRSEGCYDNGRGEQDDVIAAWDFLLQKNKKNILLAGYSFGAMVAMNVFIRMTSISDIILVSPPFAMDSAGTNKDETKSGLIVCGDEDQFCQIPRLKKWAHESGFQIKIVEGADHFYINREDDIRHHVHGYLSHHLRK
jgi:hypothetical protein